MKNYEILKLLFKEYGHENVLFVGFDIAKYEHVCMVWNGYKEVQLKAYTFMSDESGYVGLKQKLDEIIETSKPKCIFFGCEPSGTYYLNLMYQLNSDYPDALFRLVNPKATSSQRSVAMERSKTDPIDVNAILEIMVQGNTYTLPINDHIFDEIKELVRWIDRLTKDQTSMKNRIHLYLNELYPGFEKGSSPLVSTKSGQKFLMIIPEPKCLKRMTYEEIIELFKEHGYRLKPSYAKRFAMKAKSMLITDRPLIQSKVKTLRGLVEQYALSVRHYKEAESRLSELLQEFHFTDPILELSGMGIVTLSRIIAYLNNPYRFRTATQVAQFAGLAPKKNQSGTSDKRETISRFGHTKLRSVMVQLAHQLISSTGYFTAFHNRLIIDKGKNTNLAVTATAHKVLRVIFHMMMTGERFNPPTADNPELAKSKINRYTKKKQLEYQKKKKTQSLTQDMLATYLTRV